VSTSFLSPATLGVNQRMSATSYADVSACVDAILDRLGHELVVGTPLGVGKPTHLLNELVERALADPGLDLEIWTALSLSPPDPDSDLERRLVEPLSERLFGGYPELTYDRLLQDGELPENVEVDQFYFQPGEHVDDPAAQQSHYSVNYTHALRTFADAEPNLLLQLVGAGERDGIRYYTLGSNPDLSRDLIDRMRDRREAGERLHDRRPGHRRDAVHVRRGAGGHLGVRRGARRRRLQPAAVRGAGRTGLDGRPRHRPPGQHARQGRRHAPDRHRVARRRHRLGAAAPAHPPGDVPRGRRVARRPRRRPGTGRGRRRSRPVRGGSLRRDRDVHRGVPPPLRVRRALADRLRRPRRTAAGRRRRRRRRPRRRGPRRAARVRRHLDAARGDGRPVSQTLGRLQGRGPLGRRPAPGRRRAAADGRLGPGSQGDLASRALGDSLDGGDVLHGAFFVGSQGFYEGLRALDEDARRTLRMRSVQFTNERYGDEALKRRQRRDARFVNTP